MSSPVIFVEFPHSCLHKSEKVPVLPIAKTTGRLSSSAKTYLHIEGTKFEALAGPLPLSVLRAVLTSRIIPPREHGNGVTRETKKPASSYASFAPLDRARFQHCRLSLERVLP